MRNEIRGQGREGKAHSVFFLDVELEVYDARLGGYYA